ncbi:MAG: glyoxalase [Chromatiales bacterium]|jgi:uncharacterized protein|nr:glyoxalase [Chromatiales bacterium]
MNEQFHLSIPVASLDTARAFYCDILGCSIGRSSTSRIDIDFFGNHVVAHLAEDEAHAAVEHFESDGATVSVRHFGAIIAEKQWLEAADRLDGQVEFTMAPQVIRAGTVEEQRIMMMRDGCGNIVELKSIPPERVFATEPAD